MITDFDSKLADLHKAWVDIAKDALEKAPAIHEQFTDVVPVDGTSLDYGFLDNMPSLKDWIGNKAYESLRANSHSIPVQPKEASFAISRVQVQGDRHGMIAKSLSDQAAAGSQLKDELVIDKLLAGFSDTGYDGVAFFSTAHPNGPSNGTQSNTATSALASAAFDTARETMRKLRSESGRSLNIRPNILLVGPSLETTALDIVKAELTGGGNSNSRASYGVEVVVSPRIQGSYDNYWFLLDGSKAAKAMALGVQRDIEPKDNLDAYQELPEYHFSMEGDLACGYGLWQLAYGSTGAS
ncbi:MAG: Mu-like prophage major head subunit gpT family protein [Coleofasciculus sp. C2-GNP5-27]